MTKTICVMVALALGAPALAADKAPAGAAPAAAAPVGAAPAGAPDMTKMGPMSRPVTKPDKKGTDELYKAFEDAMKKGDLTAAAALVDFPVIMLSDDSKGVVKHFNATHEQWLAIFSPMVMNMPKDMKMSGKHAVTFLSDDLAVSVEQDSMTMGKTKGKWSSMSVLTLVDGKWKFKEMAEAGWGDMPPAGAPAAMPAAAKGPAPAAAPKK